MEEFKFFEKQYLGLNRMSLSRRIAFALFCFVAYYWRQNHEKSGELFEVTVPEFSLITKVNIN